MPKLKYFKHVVIYVLYSTLKLDKKVYILGYPLFTKIKGAKVRKVGNMISR